MAASGVGETVDPQPRAGRTSTVVWDGIAVACCWLFVSFLSTAQRWTWLNTPDAEFYASLGLFGHDVTDRTASPAYYWTRLGVIAPVRTLTEMLGPWAGYHAYWLLLVGLVVLAVFTMVRRFSTRLIASLMALLTSLSTVVLAFLGNPYVTGTAMTAMFVAISGLMWTLPVPGVVVPLWRRTIAPLVTGLALGWLAMTNPNATIMTATMWVVGTAVITVHQRGRWRRHLAVVVPATIIGAAISFLALLMASRVLFRDLDWWETTLFWSKALDLSGYVGDSWAFLRDVSMVVPLTVMLTVLAVLAVRRRDPVVQVAALLSPSAFGVTLLIVLLRPNGTLEVGHYQALQWPPALSALALVVAATVARRRGSTLTVAVAAIAVVLTIVAGHWSGTMQVSTGWLIALVTATAFVAAVAWMTRAGDDGRRAGTALVALVACIGLLMAGFQLLQNARRPAGVMAEGVYSSAYNASDAEARLTSSYEAQKWLIANTRPEDTVMLWVDADWANGEQTLLSMAAFQIFGINQLTPERTMEGAGVGNGRAANATVIAMYGKSMQAIVDFWSTIPREIGHTDPLCSTYPWPDPAVPEAHLCLTRLTWP